MCNVFTVENLNCTVIGWIMELGEKSPGKACWYYFNIFRRGNCDLERFV